MATIESLKSRVNIHDLAARLGLVQPEKGGNYRSPHHPDKSPSLQIGGTKYPDGFYDHSSGQGGDCIDLVKYCLGLADTPEAMRWIKDQYGITDAPTALLRTATNERFTVGADDCPIRFQDTRPTAISDANPAAIFQRQTGSLAAAAGLEMVTTGFACADSGAETLSGLSITAASDNRCCKCAIQAGEPTTEWPGALSSWS